eukprot:Tamp_14831.p2 GENE.Tamp_14831~~Tamp_14831.p2  ORF type:complete len:213 (+),score=73.59 Tamp_14831:56-640(+)
MGAKASVPKNVDKKDIEKVEELKLVSNFTDTEVARLIKIFNDIDIDRGGTISKDELFQLKAFHANPFLSRIIHVSGERHSKRAGENDESDPDSLDIKEFAELMSVFSIRASREQKLRYAFKIYDCDGDGKIGKDDLRQTLDVITAGKMEHDFMTTVVDEVFREADSDDDGFIHFDDFAKVVMNTDIEGKLTFDF